ncbi:MAG: DNA polymerase III subunit epsilon [Alphaproteobacteria bacterium]|nr:DNA polymerase III subunit epsilon [Alphaproteobacteria bacterium]
MTIQENVREIVLDTETTGLNFEQGDRVVDIACVELVNHIATGKTYQVYINPEREMSEESVQITGLTNEYLADKPVFREIADDFLRFINNDTLIIHNAKFDISFLNGELELLGKPLFQMEKVVDTLDIARKKFPGSPLTLDALCRRFNIDTSVRSVHGALIDCYLLAEVYINLMGGRQGGFSFEESLLSTETSGNDINIRQYISRCFKPSNDEIQAHEVFLNTLNNARWNEFIIKDHN